MNVGFWSDKPVTLTAFAIDRRFLTPEGFVNFVDAWISFSCESDRI
jgi:hypothetical protein